MHHDTVEIEIEIDQESDRCVWRLLACFSRTVKFTPFTNRTREPKERTKTGISHKMMMKKERKKNAPKEYYMRARITIITHPFFPTVRRMRSFFPFYIYKHLSWPYTHCASTSFAHIIYIYIYTWLSYVSVSE